MNGNIKIWRVSTEKGFQLIEAPSHKAAAKLAVGKVLRIRSVKTPLQLHLRSVVQARRKELDIAKTELAALHRDFIQAKREYTSSQLALAAGQLFIAKWDKKIQDQANLVLEAKRELFDAEENRRKQNVLVA
jgi:hypothetical protein